MIASPCPGHPCGKRAPEHARRACRDRQRETLPAAAASPGASKEDVYHQEPWGFRGVPKYTMEMSAIVRQMGTGTCQRLMGFNGNSPTELGFHQQTSGFDIETSVPAYLLNIDNPLFFLAIHFGPKPKVQSWLLKEQKWKPKILKNVGMVIWTIWHTSNMAVHNHLAYPWIFFEVAWT